MKLSQVSEPALYAPMHEHRHRKADEQQLLNFHRSTIHAILVDAKTSTSIPTG